ncbi:rhoptry neck protein 12, putative [Plasmodium gallinaceum]|uniref:Rhoptry neck protein 12, putative n=1 Tax=Plasmodium gallinaceum TaxID=5849 RepID=A0A1J1GY04_PLAGA|nr:rhoptry neck protein 12, putative [Plasmodium gallinaceum]CRG97182.1 rhoptry neck protein 12, putative [Plasmodium gallinaceum]
MRNINIFLLLLYYLIVLKSVDNLRVSSAEFNTIEAEKENINDKNNDSIGNRREAINRDTETTNMSKNENTENKSENANETNKDTDNISKNEDKMKIENITKDDHETSKSDANKNEETKNFENSNEKNIKSLDNFASTKSKPNLQHKNNASLKNIVILDEAFNSAKKVCEFVVIKNEHFKNFCQMTNLYEQAEKLKKNDNELYQQVISNSYENEGSSSFQLLKEDDDSKLFKEKDNHDPRLSILFMYEKFCVGGVPLACSNILKYDNIFEVNERSETNETKQDEQDENKMIHDIEGDGSSVDEKTGTQENISDLTDNSNESI